MPPVSMSPARDSFRPIDKSRPSVGNCLALTFFLHERRQAKIFTPNNECSRSGSRIVKLPTYPQPESAATIGWTTRYSCLTLPELPPAMLLLGTS